MKYFSVLGIFVLFAVAVCYAAIGELSEASGDPAASLAEKKTEKRGIYGFGYGHGLGGGYYGHGHAIGYPHYGGYGGYHHGYAAAAAPYYGHGYYPHYSHGFYH